MLNLNDYEYGKPVWFFPSSLAHGTINEPPRSASVIGLSGDSRGVRVDLTSGHARNAAEVFLTEADALTWRAAEIRKIAVPAIEAAVKMDLRAAGLTANEAATIKLADSSLARAA